MKLNHIELSDCFQYLKTLPTNSVDCVVTSPPYYRLRNYNHKKQIGLEKTPKQYISKLVKVFAEVHRVLKPTGTLWLNMGDSYAGSYAGQSKTGAIDPKNNKTLLGMKLTRTKSDSVGYKPKDLMSMPWRLAFALQDAGWYLRQDIIWSKSNPMPESVKDRCSKSHEYIFLLTKSKKYHFDYKAIQEPAVGNLSGNASHKYVDAYDAGDEKSRTKQGLLAYSKRSARDNFKREASKRAEIIPDHSMATHRPDRADGNWDVQKRNKWSVWTVATKPFTGAHMAVFPIELIKPCILAGCVEGGVVLDPFMGRGTTAYTAYQLHRKFIGCELNPDYHAFATKWVGNLLAQTTIY